MPQWRLLPFRRTSAVENMAIDEAIFRESIRAGNAPTLRFYGWLRPTLSLGHFQDFGREVDEEACLRLGIGIIRRPTGGKAVLHDRELTYAVIAGEDVPPFPPDILETFRIISRCVAAGLAAIGIEAALKGSGRQDTADRLRASCFSFPSRHELIAGGRKICGAAQIRSHGAFLQHGSLLTAFDPVRTCAVILPHGDGEEQIRRLRQSVTTVGEQGGREIGEEPLSRFLQEGFERQLGIRFAAGELTPAEEGLKAELMAKKYGRQRWNREGRSMEWTSAL